MRLCDIRLISSPPHPPSLAVNWQVIFYIVSFNAILETTDPSSVPSESRVIPKNPPTQPLFPPPPTPHPRWYLWQALIYILHNRKLPAFLNTAEFAAVMKLKNCSSHLSSLEYLCTNHQCVAPFCITRKIRDLGNIVVLSRLSSVAWTEIVKISKYKRHAKHKVTNWR